MREEVDKMRIPIIKLTEDNIPDCEVIALSKKNGAVIGNIVLERYKDIKDFICYSADCRGVSITEVTHFMLIPDLAKIAVCPVCGTEYDTPICNCGYMMEGEEDES